MPKIRTPDQWRLLPAPKYAAIEPYAVIDAKSPHTRRLYTDNSKYPWLEVMPGEFFEVLRGSRTNMSLLSGRAGKRYGRKFATTSGHPGAAIRVRRIK